MAFQGAGGPKQPPVAARQDPVAGAREDVAQGAVPVDDREAVRDRAGWVTGGGLADRMRRGRQAGLKE